MFGFVCSKPIKGGSFMKMDFSKKEPEFMNFQQDNGFEEENNLSENGEDYLTRKAGFQHKMAQPYIEKKKAG
jgi:hypothetical protein